MTLYSVYGLQIDSQVQLPELPPGSGPAEVTVRLDDVPLELSGAVPAKSFYDARPGTFLMRVPEVARYLVLDGKEIVIQPLPNASAELVRIFLLGAAFGALLHQRGLLVMHASSIQTTRGAVLFVGPSGNGKSTTVAALVRRGYAMLADDVTAISVSSAADPVAFPSFPRQRLAADVAFWLDYELDKLPRVENTGKYLAPVNRFCSDALPVHSVYALEVGEETRIRIEAVEKLHRFAVIAENTYRGRFLKGLGLREMHFRAAGQLASVAPIRRITRPPSSLMLDQLVAKLEEEIGAPSTASPENGQQEKTRNAQNTETVVT